MFFLVIFLVTTHGAAAQFEGEPCTDQTQNTPGECCRLSACSQARDDLRNRLTPTPCSFDVFMPIVCCRSGCRKSQLPQDAANATAGAREGDAGGAARFSEQMCAAFDNMLASRRMKREAYNYDYDDYESEEYQPQNEQFDHSEHTIASSVQKSVHSHYDRNPYPSEQEFPPKEDRSPYHPAFPYIKPASSASPNSDEPKFTSNGDTISNDNEPGFLTHYKVIPYNSGSAYPPSESKFSPSKTVMPVKREPVFPSNERGLPTSSEVSSPSNNESAFSTSESVVPATDDRLFHETTGLSLPTTSVFPNEEAFPNISEPYFLSRKAVIPLYNKSAIPTIESATPSVDDRPFNDTTDLPMSSTSGHPNEKAFQNRSEPYFPSSKAVITRYKKSAIATSESEAPFIDDQPLHETTGLPMSTTSVKTPVYGVVGGTDAFVYEFPHMAALGWPLQSGGFTFKCGGTLISDRYVLTAGHCLNIPRDTSLANVEPTIVRLGDLNILDDASDGAKPLDIKIARIKRHPNYRPPIKYFDIALIELLNVVILSEHIKPACLWPKNSFDDIKNAIVTGWGTTVSGSRDGSAILQKVQVDILETSVCQTLLMNSRNRNWQGFNEHQLCAGVLAGGKDACQGDSGGPLQIQMQGYTNKYYVIGVTSFGRECGKSNLPGVYTRVSAFLDWIESVVWPTGA